jgi:hypothetical protein
MNKKHSTILLIGTLLFLYGCRDEDSMPGEETPTSTNRTILVYFGVDNNFRDEARINMELFTSNWNKDINGNLFVYADAGEIPVLVHI